MTSSTYDFDFPILKEEEETFDLFNNNRIDDFTIAPSSTTMIESEQLYHHGQPEPLIIDNIMMDDEWGFMPDNDSIPSPCGQIEMVDPFSIQQQSIMTYPPIPFLIPTPILDSSMFVNNFAPFSPNVLFPMEPANITTIVQNNNEPSMANKKTIEKNVDPKRSILQIIEGLNYEPEEKERQRGGKDNTKPLPRHVISIDNTTLDKDEEYTMSCHLMGYERKATKRHIINTLKTVRIDPTETSIEFEDLVVQHASQFYGRKPFTLLFSLTCDNEEIAHTETYPFQTITKRGEEKRVVKRLKGSKTSISKLQPNRYHVKGDALIRIYLANMPPAKLSDVRVKFGSVTTRVYAVIPEEDMVIGEIPPSNVTDHSNDVHVSVSFDKGKTYIKPDSNTDLFSYKQP
jgi:hypothetical protein